MANDLNLCQFIGRLGKDPEVRYTGEGKAIASFSIASGWKFGSKEGTEWLNVTAFGKLAEIVNQYVHKGDQVYIAGRLQTDKWEDQSGNTRYSTKIIADKLQMLGSKSGYQDSRSHQPPAEDDLPSGQSQSSGGSPDFDEIPFSPVDHRCA